MTRSGSSRGYPELHAASAFSFLDGASLPEDLVARAVELELPAVALVDTNGVYGAPRFYKAARAAGIQPFVGAEVALEESGPVARGLVPRQHEPGESAAVGASRLTLLVASREGYRSLCRLLTEGARGRAKGDARVTLDQLEEHAAGLVCLTGGDEGPVVGALARRDDTGDRAARAMVDRLAAIFPRRLHLELQRHLRRDEKHLEPALVALAERHRLPLVATNGVRHARAEGKSLFDVLTCIRHGVPLDEAGSRLVVNRERHLKGAREMSELFADLPRALDGACELARALDFTLADLGYRFPAYPLPDGETPMSYLRHITWNGARARFRPLTARAQRQIEHELAVIAKLDLAGYFLIVWEIIQFCREQGILVQGRGSAANSAVCYALSITAIDPVRMGLLFERFLSEERGEWPDIDLDLPSGAQRERVIQHVYERYGPHGAAMTATVISYRDRSAAREVAKALGFSAQQCDKLSRRLGSAYFGEIKDAVDLATELAAVGLDPGEVRARHFMRLWLEIQDLPRHLGQHTGGMVVAAGRLDEVVPLEPASMPGRVVVQWDKEDCADLGIIKVDLLGLGMMAALEEAVPMIERHEKVCVDLAHLPAGDPATYEMLRRADTVGVFQVESRAQMASLPRNAPRNFYDLVVQVAIIRPGPIVGGMVHPYFERRQGREPVTYPHPCLEPILSRTLGVPIFQEQVLRMAMEAAGFTGGEAEELRRAMGFKRSEQRMAAIEARLREGMSERGIEGAAQDGILRSITAFAMYGFPESHAASFALLAYASAYLKVHHAAAFYASLLNAWPMGFYHPATLVKDAERRGVRMLPIDVASSRWRCAWEEGGVRLGLRFVKGLKEKAGAAIEAARRAGPFRDSAELARRTGLGASELEALARAGALGCFGLTRRAALWQVAKVGRRGGPLLAELPVEGASPLPEMSPVEETIADLASQGLTTGPHFVAHLRPALDARGVLPAAEALARRHGERVRVAGGVIVRQRPGTAKGFVFLTLEDETGMIQAIVRPKLFQEQRLDILGSTALIVEGVVQQQDGTCSVKADRFERLLTIDTVPSHDFH
ncbi:MAG: error-prone DNA polymerase [Deltaproteobacteria bacterium]|nr:error-prone DNA polymerase [Deltaproteobacteria bacterium]